MIDTPYPTPRALKRQAAYIISLWFILGGALAFLSGCVGVETPYQPMKNGVGYKVDAMGGNTYRLQYFASPATSYETVADYVLLLAAETAQKHGGTHFRINDIIDRSKSNVQVTPGFVVMNGGLASVMPATSEVLTSPGVTVLMEVGSFPGRELYEEQPWRSVALINTAIAPRIKKAGYPDAPARPAARQ